MNWWFFSCASSRSMCRAVLRAFADGVDSNASAVRPLQVERNNVHVCTQRDLSDFWHDVLCPWKPFLFHKKIRLWRNFNDFLELHSRYHIYSPTHRLLLNSTLWFLTAISCASKRACFISPAPFFSTKLSCFSASSIDMPRMKDAQYHIFLGLYLMFSLTWHTNWNRALCISLMTKAITS